MTPRTRINVRDIEQRQNKNYEELMDDIYLNQHEHRSKLSNIKPASHERRSDLESMADNYSDNNPGNGYWSNGIWHER